MKTPPVITDKGRKVLGEFLKQSREAQQMSLDTFLAKVKNKTGQEISKSTLSELERGNSVPRWDTISILAWSNFFTNSATGESLSAAQLFEIACGLLDPFTGERADQNGSVSGSERIRKDQLADQKGSVPVKNAKRGSVQKPAFNGSDRELVTA